MKEALHITVLGAVQGVGFRPFVYRLAKEIGLRGWVMNSAQGVYIEIEGAKHLLEQFLLRLEKEKPEIASIHSLEYSTHDPAGFPDFTIRHEKSTGEKSAVILPDIATCTDCLNELFDPGDRRYQYPFINCTNCGPRFSIIEAVPYDRPNTSMKTFKMCAACQREYDDPGNRRFHAQPNACPDCGPELALWNTEGELICNAHESLLHAAEIIRGGKILALKGIGGFQLVVDARNHHAVEQLRKRKHRPEKPFALMYPTIEMVKGICQVSTLEERLLRSTASPIVLLKRKKTQEENGLATLAKNISPGNPNLGIMLPYTPLHHLLIKELGFPVVATSGNLSDEPICIKEDEALERLRGIADAFLIHNRPIVRHVDDSVARVMAGNEQLLRRARGYAPLPIHLWRETDPMLAVGAHLKNTVAVSKGKAVFASQHIGDLETAEAYEAFLKVIRDFQDLYEITPEAVACDLHPEYLSSKYAGNLGTPIVQVQHHYAHVLACMADNEIEGPVVGVSWDGTGLGADGTIWGGEFLVCDKADFRRAAHLRTFKLPGGDAAIKQPRRSALGILYEIFGETVFHKREFGPVRQFSQKELGLVKQMLEKNLNCPVTSSAGRLFDAVAAILNLRQEVGYEGQAAMELEFAVEPGIEETNEFHILEGQPAVIDWEPMILQICDAVQRKEAIGRIAAKFHNTLASIILSVAKQIGEQKVVLSGGCFQNAYLTEQTVGLLRKEGFRPYWHQRVPPNDGGIVIGQLMAIELAKARSDLSKKAETL